MPDVVLMFDKPAHGRGRGEVLPGVAVVQEFGPRVVVVNGPSEILSKVVQQAGVRLIEREPKSMPIELSETERLMLHAWFSKRSTGVRRDDGASWGRFGRGP